MNKLPLVSVVMSVHNGEKYLAEAVESILNQTFTDFEFIIIDDGSSDSSLEIIQHYRELDDRIVLIQNEENIGLTKSLNKGIAAARGEYIARMDADDISLPERFDRQLAFLKLHEDIGVLGTAFQIIDEKGIVNPKVLLQGEEWEMVFWLLYFGVPIAHPTVIIRTELLKKVNGYDPTLQCAQDYDLWCRISSITRLTNLAESFLYYRYGYTDQISTNKLDKQFETAIQIRQKFSRELTGKTYSKYIVQLWSGYKDVQTSTICWNAVQAIEDLYDHFISMVSPITLNQLLTIRLDASRRIRQIIWQLPFTPRKIWRLFQTLFQIYAIKMILSVLNKATKIDQSVSKA